MVRSDKKLTLADFFALPESDTIYEFVEGNAKPKAMSPKRFHSRLTGALFLLLIEWGRDRGEVGIKWEILLNRRGKDWVPVPDLLYISNHRLGNDRVLDRACSVPPELAIEIISPEQSFGKISEKAIDYLQAGVSRVWIVDPSAKNITIFYPNAIPQAKTGDEVIADPLLDGLELTPDRIFTQAGIPD